MEDRTKFKFIDNKYTPVADKEILDKKVTEIGLTLETARLLDEGGIDTIGDLCRCQMRHIYRIRGVGKKHAFEVLRKLQSYNLDFMRAPKEEKSQNPLEGQNKDKNPQKVENKQDKVDKKDNKNKKKDKNKNNPQNKPGDNKGNVKIAGNDGKNKGGNKANAKTNPKDKRDRGQSVEPKRVKVNSYEVDITPSNNMAKSKNIREERSRKVAKLISNLPPVKNPDGLYKFYKHGKWGYKDESGKVVIEPKYSEAFEFKEGMACVEMDEKCGFINKAGEIVIDIQYDTACSFSEGLASVTKEDKCGYINMEGNIVFPFEYESATSFENGISLVKKDGKWGYMDKVTGEIRLR